MTAWPVVTIRVVAASACLACATGAALQPAQALAQAPAQGPAARPTRVQTGPATTSQPQQRAELARPAPLPQPQTLPQPAAQPLPQPPPVVPSELGRRLIQQPGGQAAGGAPASPPAATRAAAPAAPSAPNFQLPRVAGALAIVLALIFALRAVMRRTIPGVGAAGASGAVQLLSRTILSPRQHLMLVRVGRRLIVVADSGGQMSALSEISDPDEVAALVGQIRDEKLSAGGATFGGLLGRIRNGMEAATAPPASEGRDGPRRVESLGEADPDSGPDDAPDDPAARATRQEIDGLLAKVRLISHQFKGT